MALGKSSEVRSPAKRLWSTVGTADGRDKHETLCKVPGILVTSFGCD